MKKFFRMGKGKKDGAGSDSKSLSKAPSEASLNTLGYALKEKELNNFKLHKAAWQGDLGKVRQLAKKDPSALDKDNRTPMHLAAVKGHAAIIEELLAWKAKPNIGDNDARTPLMKAIQCDQIDCGRLLLEARADPNSQDKNGEACLHYAARDGHLHLVKLLLESGKIDVNVQNNDGTSPLHLGSQQGHKDLCAELVKQGADVDIQDTEGKTALMRACHVGNVDITKLLCQNNANVILKDSKGWTADDIALMANQDTCRNVLGAYSSRSGKSLSGATGGGATGRRSQPQATPIAGYDMHDEASDDEHAGDDDSVGKLSDANLDSWADSEDSEIDNKKPNNQKVTGQQ